MVEDRVYLVSREYKEINFPCLNPGLKKIEFQKGKRPLDTNAEEEEAVQKLYKESVSLVDTTLTIGGFLRSHSDQSNKKKQLGENSDLSSLIAAIGHDNSISCLIRCSRADYGAIAAVNQSFRSVIKSGEVYRLRRQHGMVEHWVYFSRQLMKWEVFDPSRRHWMRLPNMNPKDGFPFSDKESLAVGTELLVFGMALMAHVTYRYSLLTNTWSSGIPMNSPRCLFGSASLGEIAIFAGGCNLSGNVLSSAEMYNSEAGAWKTLPSMNTPRKMCSGVFMDGKFYVIGGTNSDSELLTCGEEYNLETQTWTVIPKMSPVRPEVPREFDLPVTSEAPPLVAVVNNQLYAADYAEMVLRKYNKENREWSTLGSLPEQASSVNGWGLAFRACGDRILVIGGPRTVGVGCLEVNSWVPNADGPPQWELLGRKRSGRSGSFVYNCAVMGC